MIINVHAGHNPDGQAACGAVGFIRESTEARKVKEEVIRLLTADGHTVYDCTVDDGISQGNVLSKIAAKCNTHAVDLDVSIHFNAGRNDYRGDNLTGGTEAWVYSRSSKAMRFAERICKKIADNGFRNRGVKTSTSLYILKKTKAPALLIECCFVDDADDVKLYDANSMARAIAEGISNTSITDSGTNNTITPNTVPDGEFKVKIIDSALNIRSGAGTIHKITGCIRDKGTYTITQTSGDWGKLKSGAGWICISAKYVKLLR